MKNISKITLFIFLQAALISCNDVLQVEDQKAVDADKVFNDPAYAELFLNNLYGFTLPGWRATSGVTMTDESLGRNDYLDGSLIDPTSGNPDATLGDYSSDTYRKIRNINVFIDELEKGDIDETTKNTYLGQALFLRAWMYWQLVFDYGGVPMVMEAIDINDDISEELPRSTASECVSLIVEDLDNALELIGTYGADNYGRITKSVVASFKGRVLLFYASPMFDPDGMTNPDGIASRWEAAYQANLEAKQIAESEGHELFADFSKIFLQEDNPENIFIRKYTTGYSTHGFENQVRPGSAKSTGSATSTPSWDLATSFPMKSGLAIDDPASGYDENVFWKDRDPRFYATIAYNSCAWKFKGRDDERQWAYNNNDQENLVPLSGMYLRKHINTELAITEVTATPTDWVEIRFAEVLLNLAESANEVGKQTEALELLYAIRDRAGIEEGTGNYGIPSGLSKGGLREVIMNERKIEMAYESKRYWDLKRRNLYVNGADGSLGTGLNSTIRKQIRTSVNTAYIIGINPGLSGAAQPEDSAFFLFENAMRDTINWDNPENYENYFTTEIEDFDLTPIQYQQPKYNFSYMPFNALVKNSNLEQTIGWLDENGELGTFDPLQD